MSKAHSPKSSTAAWSRSIRRRLSAEALALLGVVCWLLVLACAASADSCPNAAFRVAAAANLPDCRAYEMVSPPNKNGYDIDFGNQAVAISGNSVTYDSLGAFASNPAGSFFNQYLSTRGPSGWTTLGISPPQASAYQEPAGSGYEGFSTDLSQMVVQSDFPTPDQATAGTFDLFLRNPDGSFHLLDPKEPTGLAEAFVPAFRGASSDYSHIAFESPGALTPNAPPFDNSDKVYEWVNGQLSLVSILPNGTAIDGVIDAPGGAPMLHAVSADGSRVYWGDNSFIYVRANGSTTQIDRSECKACTTAAGPDSFWTASTDGSKAIFTSKDRLTDGSTANQNGTGAGDLYRYDANSRPLHLTDLTVDHNLTDTGGADVQGVVGTSADGSYVYFVANGVLAPGAKPGDCSGGTTGCSLYLWHSGTTRFIATLGNLDSAVWTSSGAFAASEFAQVSSDGLHLLFSSVAPLAAGYANANHSEVYRYDAAGSGKLACVSCYPSNAPATGDAVLSAPADIGVSPTNAVLTSINNMSSDGGRVFFESTQSLVPQATNGTDDVYEWEANGTGSCQTAGGCVYLISTGRSGSPSHFLDATASGNDVFVLTREQLVGQDTDQNLDVYDARVGGGFPQPPPAPQPCSGEDCHGQLTNAPSIPVAASVTFFGPGNARSASSPASVSVFNRTVHGTRFFVRVKVPGAGRITITGAQIDSARRFVARAGTYRLRVGLTRKARSALRHKRKLKLRVRVSYVAADGQGASRVITLAVES
jgi:hypothetical protein